MCLHAHFVPAQLQYSVVLTCTHFMERMECGLHITWLDPIPMRLSPPVSAVSDLRRLRTTRTRRHVRTLRPDQAADRSPCPEGIRTKFLGPGLFSDQGEQKLGERTMKKRREAIRPM